MPPRILIAPPAIRLRRSDVERVLGGTVVAGGNAEIVVFHGLQPEGGVSELARRTGASLVGFAPAPLAVAALEAANRPLGYRLIGLDAGEHAAECRSPDTAEMSARLSRLARKAELLPSGALVLPAGAEALADCVWLDPYDREKIGAETALALAEDFAGFLLRDGRASIGLNITVGKRKHVEAFLSFPRRRMSQHSRLAPAMAEAKRTGGRIVVWASWRHDRTERRCAAEDVPLARMEDGFLRSVGLGAAFVRSMSLVVDSRGIYYDPSRPSDLENILQTAEFDADLLERAQALRGQIVAANLTKYNIGGTGGVSASGPAGRLVPAGRTGVLVPGQVEDDASILLGGASVRTNLELLRAARERWPDGFLIYKPHPDVEAGYRVGKLPDAEALAFCDLVVRDRSISELFLECGAIETMTSLAGFEGLLRGLKVATHGQPFYSGWGLTDDLAPHPRRMRRRGLDELVAAALILYPRYVDPVSGLPCGPETVMRRLAASRDRAHERGPMIVRHAKHALALVRHRVLGGLLRRLT